MAQQSQKLKNIKRKYGFTLIEIIVFIIVMGIVGVTIFTSMNMVLKESPASYRRTVALQTATHYMEWYIGQRYLNGFNTIPLGTTTDTVNNYKININVGEPKYNYKDIIVTVTDMLDKNASPLSLSLLLTDY